MGISSPTQRREPSPGFIQAKVQAPVHNAIPAQHPLITATSHSTCGDVWVVNTPVLKSCSYSHLGFHPVASSVFFGELPNRQLSC